jgi:hypothetical protein
MKTFWAVTVALLIPLVIVGPLAARDLKDKVKVEVDNGTVQNQADVPLRQVKVVGKAFDASGKLLGTATTTTETEKLAPGKSGHRPGVSDGDRAGHRESEAP